MANHHDILADRESMQRPFLESLALHAGFFALIAMSGIFLSGQTERWGDPLAGGMGSAVAVTPVNTIPLPAKTGERNPVANDTKSKVPAPPEPQKKTREKPPPKNAVALKSRKPKPTAERPTRRNVNQMSGPEEANQLYSSSGQAAVSPIYGSAPGSGGIAVGPDGVFGTRFGAYAQILRDRVANKWRTGEVDPRIREAPVVIITFVLYRNGNVSDVQVTQSSGIGLLDRSAQRAILEAAPFPPIPAGYEKDSAIIEFWFQLKR